MATGHFDYINSKRIPYPNREYTESFDLLMGGVNTFDQPFNLKSNEAAMMQNLSWRAGVLGCRRGQVLKTIQNEPSAFKLPKESLLHNPYKYLSVAPFLYKGWMLVQATVNDPVDDPFQIYAIKIQPNGRTAEQDVGTVALVYSANIDCTEPGVFFQYREQVFFKGPGAYESFAMITPTTDQVFHFALHPFIPTIQIDTEPSTGAGNRFQEENRLSDKKKVVFVPTPAGTTVFQLPVHPVDAILEVTVDGVFQTFSEDYTDDEDAGTVTFLAGHEPATDSTVAVVYSKDNPEARGSLMECTAAIAFGGAQELCVVIGGPASQPNAYFWSDNNSNVADPTYFPINHYNLAGENDEPITAFGKQQNMLVIFQPNATGRAVFGTETVNGLVTVTMNYTRINVEIGCDLPGSLQLVQNNLVWANRKYGVCRLKDSSAAYENNITVLSRKINGGRYNFPGLLGDIASIESADDVRSTDTGTRYILTVGTDAYEWNYELSSHEDPSWFLHTHVYGVGFVPLANDVLYEVTEDGRIATFEDGVFADFGEAIEKFYAFPPRNFGTYDRLKNIMSAIFTTRADTDQNTQIQYICDYAERTDPTNMVVVATTEDTGRPYASVFRRKPGYHNIRHLQIVISNTEVGKDLSILSAQIYYTLRGRQR